MSACQAEKISLFTLMAQSNTNRVQALRQRRKALGLARVEFYLSLEHAAKVRRYISKLTKEKAA
jgi:hypothetical protein